MRRQSTLATAGLCAGFLAFSSLPASAAWMLNGTSLTDGNWNLTVSVSGNNLTVTASAATTWGGRRRPRVRNL